jgi:fructose-1-phosphate kinase PfkB-like protein
MEVTDAHSALRAARALHRDGTPAVAITLGEEGAVAVTAAGAWWARPEPGPGMQEELAAGSAVGAGDAFLASLMLDCSRGVTLDRALRRSVATGTAVLLSRGGDLVRLQDVERVEERVVLTPMR